MSVRRIHFNTIQQPLPNTITPKHSSHRQRTTSPVTHRRSSIRRSETPTPGPSRYRELTPEIFNEQLQNVEEDNKILEYNDPVSPNRGDTASPDPLNISEEPFENTISNILVNMFQDNPNSYKEAMAWPESNEWKQAIKDEYDGLIEMGTWKLVDLPKGRKPVKCHWTFVVKLDRRYKARLVAKGFTQVQGIDFEAPFSPVAPFESV